MTILQFPSPSQLVPALKGWDTWYPGQSDVVHKALLWYYSSPAKYLALEAPTGTGKSLIAAVIASLALEKTIVLTHTKGLQDQIARDFGAITADLRGKANYPCNLDDSGKTPATDGECEMGLHCELNTYCGRDGPCGDPHYGCGYFDARDVASDEKIAVTNYAYWATPGRHSLGARKLMIADEAHLVLNILTSLAEVELSTADTDLLEGKIRLPEDNLRTYKQWIEWAQDASRICDELIGEYTKQAWEEKQEAKTVSSHTSYMLKRLKALDKRINKIFGVEGDWVIELEKGSRVDTFKFQPIWPKDEAEFFFKATSKVILMSATLTPKSMKLLGIDEKDVEWIHADSQFPASRSPFYRISGPKVKHEMSDKAWENWAKVIDDIVEERGDRKGLIATGSYKRSLYYKQHTRLGDQIWTHTKTNIRQIVDEFKAYKGGAAIASPSLTTGWDFPGDECRYIIIGKVPFPDTSSKLMQARMASDKGYLSYEAMHALVQAAGRGTRSVPDWCEVFIVDANWGWFWAGYWDYSPKFFQDRVVQGWDGAIPAPLNPPELVY